MNKHNRAEFLAWVDQNKSDLMEVFVTNNEDFMEYCEEVWEEKNE